MTWYERIKDAETRGWFLLEDLVDAKDWVTCACGEQDPRILRKRGGMPLDVRLSNLGMRFYWAVRDDDVDSAYRALDLIEHRVKELLAEQEGASNG